MDNTLIAGIVGAIATIIGAVLPLFIMNRKLRKEKKREFDIIVASDERNDSIKRFGEFLAKAKEVRMCGWSLVRIMDKHPHELRDLIAKGCNVRILMMDPESPSVNSLDNVLTNLDPFVRKSQNWPEVKPSTFTKSDIERALKLLTDNRIIDGSKNSKVRLCDSLLPVSLLLVECHDSSTWFSCQIYPIHPDIRSSKRLIFTAPEKNRDNILFNSLKEQFDLAFEDNSFSKPYINTTGNIA